MLLVPAGRGRLPLPDEITLPRLDVSRTTAERKPTWLGPIRPLPSKIGGIWAWTQEDKRVWRVTIRATGARALRVRFEDFNAQGSVWLYGDEQKGPPIGPYLGRGPQLAGSFWSEFVFAETVTIEYVPDNAAAAPQLVPFRIASIAQIEDERFAVPGVRRKANQDGPRSLAGCHLDVSCYPDLETRDQPSVARVFITRTDGTHMCTGFLVTTDYNSDHLALFLTAGHCVGTQEQARNAAFLWNYQTEECYGNSDWNLWSVPLAYSYGSTLVVSKNDGDDDFSLLVLNMADVWKSGIRGLWNHGYITTVVRTGEHVSTVSHPAGSYKRAAFGRVVDFGWANFSSQGFKTIQWRLGSSEGGSSGSPILAGTGADRRVVGILVADNLESLNAESLWGPQCDVDLRVAFNRFDHIYKTIEPYLKSEDNLPTRQLVSVIVPLGNSGDTVTLRPGADGTYWIGNTAVRNGITRVTAGNGNIYVLMLSVGGKWTAEYQALSGSVTIGRLGITLSAQRLEDGTWVVVSPGSGSREKLIEGGTFKVAGNAYKLSSDGAGNWTATYLSEMVVVRLGTSRYSVRLERAEDGSWRMGRTPVSTGSVVTAPDGTQFRLVVLGGQWLAIKVLD